MIDLGPPPFVFPKPAIIRAADKELLRYGSDPLLGMIPGITPVITGASGDVRGFHISPAVGGISDWDLDVDGPLTISTNGTWTITPTSAFAATVELWGGGGGGGAQGTSLSTPNNGGSGSASSFSGLTANGGGGGLKSESGSASPGGSGGSASGGDTNDTGETGGTGSNNKGGNGGGTGGGTGGAAPGTNQNGNAGNVPGGGGSGARSSSRNASGGGGGGKATKTYAAGDLTDGVGITLTIGNRGSGGSSGLNQGGIGAYGRVIIT